MLKFRRSDEAQRNAVVATTISHKSHGEEAQGCGHTEEMA